MYDFTIKQIPSQLVLYRQGNCAHAEIGKLCGEILPAVFTYIREAGAEPGGPPFCRYAAWREQDCDLEAGFPLLAPIAAEPPLRIGQLGGGRALFTLHRGPYDKLPEAHAAAKEWLARNGMAANGTPWETYITDPAMFEDPNDWLTELYYPVR